MMTNTMINHKVMEIKELEAKIKELEALKDEIKDSLKSELDERKVDCIDTGDFRLHYVPVERQALDSKKLKEEEPETYNKYLKSSTYVRFDIR